MASAVDIDSADGEKNELADLLNGINFDAATFNLPNYEKYNKRRNKTKNTAKDDNVEINSKSLPEYAMTYELEKFKKNAMLIFNHDKFDGGEKPRPGTKADQELLETTFGNLRFEVTVEPNLEMKEIKKKINEFTAQDFSEYGCVAVVVLTHGRKDGQLRAKDKWYHERTIINRLLARDTPSLVTKPRIVIIQACRGKQPTTEVRVQSAHTPIEVDDDEKGPITLYTMPAESDLLILHSSYEGRRSARNPTHGSWFIQSLCMSIAQCPALDLESIMVHVKRSIASFEATRFNDHTKKLEMFKQMPVSTSTLTRKLYFKSSSEAVSDADAVPSTSQTPQGCVPGTALPMFNFNTCSCYLDYFEYIKNCLTYFVDENPDVKQAAIYLGLANKLIDDDGAKDYLAQEIYTYLKPMVEDNPTYRCLYFSNQRRCE